MIQEGFFFERPKWHQRGACCGTHPDLFFPLRGESNKEAKSVCEGCEVKEECLSAALDGNENFGIWGGMSERERRRIRTVKAPLKSSS